MNRDILPDLDTCPVCGSSSVKLSWEYETFAECLTCGLEGQPVEGGLKSADEIRAAIANWNRLPRLCNAETVAESPAALLAGRAENLSNVSTDHS